MSTLYLTIKPSKIFLCLLFILHALAMYAISLAALAIWIKILLGIVVFGSLVYQWWLNSRTYSLMLKANSYDQEAQLFYSQNNIVTVFLQKNFYCSPWLVILYFKDEWKKTHVRFIWFDSVEVSLFKQLKRWLVVFG